MKRFVFHPTRWLLGLALCHALPASAADAGLTPAERDAMVLTARTATAEHLGLQQGPVLQLEALRTQDDWAFLTARLRDANNGQRFDYAGTDQHAAAQAGAKSDRCVALLQRQSNGAWKVVALAVGPTDVAWQGWAAQYRAPAELLQ
ncbi:MAG: hypothetical protein Q4D74_01320 [Comamonadaceae bacterium]|nr:hypothetical protein [Comamonadaceae bacterium]